MKYMKGSVLLALLLLLGFGGVAEAQTCVVKAGSGNARAEGVTEMAGTITLRCYGARAGTGLGFGNTAPEKLETAVTLNTDITNERGTGDMIMNMDDASDTVGDDPNFTATMAGYMDEEVVLQPGSSLVRKLWRGTTSMGTSRWALSPTTCGR